MARNTSDWNLLAYSNACSRHCNETGTMFPIVMYCVKHDKKGSKCICLHRILKYDSANLMPKLTRFFAVNTSNLYAQIYEAELIYWILHLSIQNWQIRSAFVFSEVSLFMGHRRFRPMAVSNHSSPWRFRTISTNGGFSPRRFRSMIKFFRDRKARDLLKSD